MQNIKFAYWPFKGMGEITRLTFAALKVPYTEHNPTSADDWEAEARDLIAQGFDFPNLPYIKVDDFYLSESRTIPIYLCKKAGRKDMLGGESLENNIRIKEIIGVLGDVGIEVQKTYYMGDQYKGALEETVKDNSKLLRKLGFLSKFLGENDFLVGGHFTVADIMTAYTLYVVRNTLLSAELEDVVARFENLVKHMERVFSQDGIKEYLQTDSWKRPIVAPNRVPWLKEHGLV